MRAQKSQSRQFEFYFRDLDNSVLVESGDDGVVIRAVRDNFSERRKCFFIRELAAEGHIPDSYQWFCGPGGDVCHKLTWVVDRSWLDTHPASARRATQFARRLLICSAVLWLTFMGLLFSLGDIDMAGNQPTRSSRHGSSKMPYIAIEAKPVSGGPSK